MATELRIIPVRGIGEVRPGDDLAATLVAAASDIPLADGDILVVTQKVVSKAEGRLVDPSTVEPSHTARMAAAQGHKDAHH
jgi:coenzyme F420-0:L-glutamate ligase / coenzyme F420-1:gamma-L-glutamate ligase